MNFKDDTPELGEVRQPYPKNPPIRNVLNQKPIKGKLIVFEGPDGAGKSTHVKMLVEKLSAKNKKVYTKNFIQWPLIKHSLLKSKWENCDPYTSSLIYATALNDMMNQEVLPQLYAGNIVVLDRYIYSIISRGCVRGCNKEWLENLVSYFIKPNIIINMNIPILECLERKKKFNSAISYWECGADIKFDDSIRFNEMKEEREKCFLDYQRSVQDILNKILPKEITINITKIDDIEKIHNLICEESKLMK